MSVTHRVARYAGRPLLMTADAALALAQRAQALDASAVSRRAALWSAAPGKVMARLGLTRPAAMEDDEAGAAEAPPPRPLAYAPIYAGEPELEGYGWTLCDGIACLDIEGALLDRGFVSISDAMFWGYDTIAQSLREAVAEPRVKAVFIRMDSPGGVVAGGLEALTADMRALRETGNASGKPIWVYADCAASAAYWICAQADRILAPAVGLVGSIGAVIVHQDVSDYLAKEGVKVTAIQFGAKKTDGASWKPLSDDAHADLQAEIDAIGERFIADVAAGREILSRGKLIRTEAGVFQAEHPDAGRSGRALGFVDAIASEEEAFAALLKHVSGALPAPSAPQRAPAHGNAAISGAILETDDMRKATADRLRAALARKAATDEEKLDAIRNILNEADETEAEGDEEDPEAEGDDDETEAEDGDEEESDAENSEDEESGDEEDEEEPEGKKAAAFQRRAQAILDLPQARGREKLAAQLAIKGVSVADAKDILAAAPKASRLIGAVPDPKLGAPADSPPAQSEAAKAADFVRACHTLATGAKPKA